MSQADFEKLMANKGGRDKFKNFCASEYSEENVLFWIACEELKELDDPDDIEEKAQEIYDEYIDIVSDNVISLDGHLLEAIEFGMEEPDSSTFDGAQDYIFTVMFRDSYPRFLESGFA